MLGKERAQDRGQVQLISDSAPLLGLPALRIDLGAGRPNQF